MIFEPTAVADVTRSALRTYGIRGIARRASYEMQRRTGLSRQREDHKLRGQPWPDFSLPLQLNPGDVKRWNSGLTDGSARTADAVYRASRLVLGYDRMYGGREFAIGWPPAWHIHPETGAALPRDLHWSRHTDHRGIPGDIKDVWEPARMGWIGTLLRAFALTGDDHWVEAFWLAVLDWRKANPPYLGTHWMNGQEVSLRGIALLQGLAALGDHPASTGDRWSHAGGLLLDSAVRVVSTLNYALSQRNNHAISEAAFLWTVAAACPTFPQRGRLLRRAERALRETVADQFNPDGSYAQHSFTYQRLALHALLWVRWVSLQTGIIEPGETGSAIAASIALLGDLLDPSTGRLPNTGSNDGALLFRLTGTQIGDFRPLLVHAACSIDARAPVDAGPWDEEAIWFGYQPDRGLRDGSSRESRSSVELRRSALHVFRGPSSHALFRAGPLRHRLSHADQLHVDLWMSGTNVARDAGTFRYGAAPPWCNALAGADVHNAPTVPTRPQARRLGRFFWLDWPEPTVLHHFKTARSQIVVAELLLPGRPRARLRRLVARVEDSYVVADVISAIPGVVRWNLPPGTSVEVGPGSAVVSSTSFAASFVGSYDIYTRESSDGDPMSGWESVTYGERNSLVALIVPTDGTGTALAGFAPRIAQLLIPAATDIWRIAATHPTQPSLSDAVRRSVELLASSQ